MTVLLKEGKMFVKKKHELDDLLKSLNKVTPEAVEMLVEVMNDDKVDKKTRLDCAKTLVDMQIRVADTVSKDELSRAIAEIKVSGVSKPLIPDGSGKQQRPVLDFNNIQTV